MFVLACPGQPFPSYVSLCFRHKLTPSTRGKWPLTFSFHLFPTIPYGTEILPRDSESRFLTSWPLWQFTSPDFFQCFRCALVNGPPKQCPKHGWTTTVGLNQTSRQVHEDVQNHPWACPGAHSQLPPPPRLGNKLQYFQWSMLMRSPEPAGVFVRRRVPGSLPSVLLGTQAPEFLLLLAAGHKAPFKRFFFFFFSPQSEKPQFTAKKLHVSNPEHTLFRSRQ